MKKTKFCLWICSAIIISAVCLAYSQPSSPLQTKTETPQTAELAELAPASVDTKSDFSFSEYQDRISKILKYHPEFADWIQNKALSDELKRASEELKIDNNVILTIKHIDHYVADKFKFDSFSCALRTNMMLSLLWDNGIYAHAISDTVTSKNKTFRHVWLEVLLPAQIAIKSDCGGAHCPEYGTRDRPTWTVWAMEAGANIGGFEHELWSSY